MGGEGWRAYTGVGREAQAGIVTIWSYVTSYGGDTAKRDPGSQPGPAPGRIGVRTPG
ncbi:hypothetical protein GCM10010218_44290 [Streptomyces mashuensis]|uniref:Uncharacterized protein n=1 Tax=Streptomyces mashuensis TaxID=33904 RepID=A0A919EDP1_9ACTN|nr:hypothetical protein GCM10010218_44290 [Streptomyces mashuensis]